MIEIKPPVASGRARPPWQERRGNNVRLARDSTMSRGELTLVEWLRNRFSGTDPRVLMPIGDDVAAIRADGDCIALTADMLVDGVHFDTKIHRYEAIGYKALACSLSDCAGAACAPRAATVSLALPESITLEEVKRIYEGLAEAGERYGCAIVGGDTTSWEGKLAIDVAMLAEPMAARGPVGRSGAQISDTIYVSAPLGGSIAGKHMNFAPRLELARRLVLETDLHAMMDISDGLALDLHRLCNASGCDAELDAEPVEQIVSDAARQCAKSDGRSALEHALSDGEDFELLVVGGLALGDERFGLTPIGRVVASTMRDQTTMVIRDAAGKTERLEPRGYEHLR